MTTTRESLRAKVTSLLLEIAPEVDAKTLAPADPLRRQVDLDSMDWLNFLVSLHQHFGVTIPEADYAKLVSLDDVLNYLQARGA
jgi:acyl carrier protein